MRKLWITISATTAGMAMMSCAAPGKAESEPAVKPSVTTQPAPAPSKSQDTSKADPAKSDIRRMIEHWPDGGTESFRDVTDALLRSFEPRVYCHPAFGEALYQLAHDDYGVAEQAAREWAVDVADYAQREKC